VASLRSTPVAASSAQEANTLARLEGMKGKELKDLMKTMGGKPGTLKKSDLVRECHKLLLSKYDDKKKTNSVTSPSPVSAASADASSSVAGGRDDDVMSKSKVKWTGRTDQKHKQRARNLQPLSGIALNSLGAGDGHYSNNKAKRGGAYRGDDDAAAGDGSGTSGASRSGGTSNNNQKLRYKHPFGPLRDTRFGDDSFTADIDITFLGTASCVPSTTRGVSSVALRSQSDVWLFDCGESTQLQMQKSRVKPSKIKKIFLTHAHGDHSFGLPGVLCLIGQSTQEEREEKQKSRRDREANSNSNSLHGNFFGDEIEPIDIYGPEGTRDLVRATIQLTYSRVVAPFRVHELKEVPYLHGKCVKWRPPVPNVRTRYDPYYGEQEGGQDIYPDENGHYHLIEGEQGGSGGSKRGSVAPAGRCGDDSPPVTSLLTVKAAPMQHTVPCVGYVVSEADRAGRLKFDKIRPLVEEHKEALKSQLGLRDANKVYAILKNMKPEDGPFVFPDATQLHTHEFLEPTRPGRKIVIMGDTCTGEHIVPLAMHADVLIHEATNAFFGSEKSERYSNYYQLERDTLKHGHSTPEMAGRFAAQIKAKTLLLTHFSPRYRGDDEYIHMKRMWTIEDMARNAANGTLEGVNEVVAAWDQLCLPVALQEAAAGAAGVSGSQMN
jgi:ribonuclease Z